MYVVENVENLCVLLGEVYGLNIKFRFQHGMIKIQIKMVCFGSFPNSFPAYYEVSLAMRTTGTYPSGYGRAPR
jgi:hypothetical protein